MKKFIRVQESFFNDIEDDDIQKSSNESVVSGYTMDDCEVFIKYNYWIAWKVYDTEETLEKKIRKVLDNINCIDAYVLEIHDLKEFEIGLVKNRFNIKTAHDIFDLINILKVWPQKEFSKISYFWGIHKLLNYDDYFNFDKFDKIYNLFGKNSIPSNGQIGEAFDQFELMFRSLSYVPERKYRDEIMKFFGIGKYKKLYESYFDDVTDDDINQSEYESDESGFTKDDCDVFLRYSDLDWSSKLSMQQLENRIRNVVDNLDFIDTYILNVNSFHEFEICLVRGRYRIDSAKKVMALVNLMRIVWPNREQTYISVCSRNDMNTPENKRLVYDEWVNKYSGPRMFTEHIGLKRLLRYTTSDDVHTSKAFRELYHMYYLLNTERKSEYVCELEMRYLLTYYEDKVDVFIRLCSTKLKQRCWPFYSDDYEDGEIKHSFQKICANNRNITKESIQNVLDNKSSDNVYIQYYVVPFLTKIVIDNIKTQNTLMQDNHDSVIFDAIRNLDDMCDNVRYSEHRPYIVEYYPQKFRKQDVDGKDGVMFYTYIGAFPEIESRGDMKRIYLVAMSLYAPADEMTRMMNILLNTDYKDDEIEWNPLN